MNLFIYSIVLILTILPCCLQGQVTLEGIIYDEESKDRLGRVQIYNTRTHERIFNNAKGEFRLEVASTDTLIFMKDGFFMDTLSVPKQPILVLSMLRDFRYIQPVRVNARRSPVEVYEESKRTYRDAYNLADAGSLISVGPTGAGLSINAIYNLLSKDGRNARRFTAYMEQVYQDNVVDSIFTPDLVHNLLGLKGDQLHNFMIRYRPSYAFATRASHYQLTQYIKSKYNMFKILPDLRPLPELPLVDFDVKQDN
ncbi:hypothetical protein M8998_11575 [Sphingobacterium sp. lm-10]|uniref:hypothetical protein n=1 Tax=Sphingobacterium sp. lm-10 TaxID=2944904 RepID=UPI00202027B4|nr:hypothetical protein [Sphingobacterium sp. lm-10]MCL7988576.1 hypothetical protein [Sphingobacterium sp. lm-10]